jgi:hypothetical protein
MVSMSRGQLDMVRAFFCYEFETESLGRDTIPEPTPEAVAEWIDALAASGLFAGAEMRNIAAVWAAEPDALVSLLAGDVDEIAARRSDAVASATAPLYLSRAS